MVVKVPSPYVVEITYLRRYYSLIVFYWWFKKGTNGHEHQLRKTVFCDLMSENTDALEVNVNVKKA